MDTDKLIGMRVMNYNRQSIGIVVKIQGNSITIDYHGTIAKHDFPSAFSSFLELEDEDLQSEIKGEGMGAAFDSFKRLFGTAIRKEIDFLKATGGKKYRIVDGEKIISKGGEYLYVFDTDAELHFPDGTAIKLWFPDAIVNGYVVSCEDFSIIIRTSESLGASVESVEFSAEQWQLLEALTERLWEMEPGKDSLAYQVACCGKNRITEWGRINRGQSHAFNRATTEGITFIWGPPGTGKTETLANIALEHIQNGKRVLMLSYSNVSVDGALLRVAKKADLPEGTIIRYGYPRSKELLESKSLTSYQYVLKKNTALAKESQELLERRKKLKRRTSERAEINKRLGKIRELLSAQEKELIQHVSFVATTVSKATVDKAVYSQQFDVVIFDEASMAYVPQIVFSAGLAKSHFLCLGDFRQLPAIVQNSDSSILSKDIFEHTGITSAVENGRAHEWLVMLDNQFRMHPDIADFVSANMYGSMLKTAERIIEGRNEIATCTPCPEASMALVDLSGMYSVCTKTMDGSRINLMSALMCLRLAEKNIDRYEVGIITPYSAQSRLILSMIRDIQEYDKRWRNVSCATVHQFQGSEKPVIIYDAVDCFRMPYPGMLLTSLKNDTANRLFNVAITRAKGKFVLVANIDYLQRKKISNKLIFTKAIKQIAKGKSFISGPYVLDEMMPNPKENPIVYIEDREESWKRFIEDINKAENDIHIEVPDIIYENDMATNELIKALEEKKRGGVNISIRCPESIDLPMALREYVEHFEYVTNPVTIIDKGLVWFGQPLYSADFISSGEIIDTEYFPCARFFGKHTARSLQAFFEI